MFYDQTLTDLYNTAVYLPVKTELTLDSIVNVGKTIIENINRYKEDLERYVSGLNAIQRQETELNAETIEFINGYEEMAMKLETIGRLKAIIETKDLLVKFPIQYKKIEKLLLLSNEILSNLNPKKGNAYTYEMLSKDSANDSESIIKKLQYYSLLRRQHFEKLKRGEVKDYRFPPEI
jgi:hypothetical protein